MRCFFSIILIVFYTTLHAQIIPAEGDTLNYKLVGFFIPENKEAVSYLFEISANVTADAPFDDNITVKHKSSSPKAVIKLPSFGTYYTWRVTFLDKKGKPVQHSDLHHFYTGTSMYLDTSRYRIKVLTNDLHSENTYVFFDNLRALCDLNGDPVWYLPVIPGYMNEAEMVRDLKITDRGTITFMSNHTGYEIDYDAHVLWAAPTGIKLNKDTLEHYHHQVTRLSNGHYMIAGNEKVDFTEDNSNNKTNSTETKSDKRAEKSVFGIIIEYDSAGKMVWVWRSAPYFTSSNMLVRNAGGKTRASTHLNAFYFDEKNNLLYTSYRDVSRVLKIKYPSGEVIATYGESNNADADRMGKGFFYAQHNCSLNKDGDLMLFNNNVILSDGVPNTIGRKSSVLVLKEPNNQSVSLQKKWEFTCDIDPLAPACGSGGGSVVELEDGSMLVCMGSVNRNFIVTKNKKVIWNTLIQIKANDAWINMAGYRVSAIESDEKLLKIIYREKKNNK